VQNLQSNQHAEYKNMNDNGERNLSERKVRLTEYSGLENRQYFII